MRITVFVATALLAASMTVAEDGATVKTPTGPVSTPAPVTGADAKLSQMEAAWLEAQGRSETASQAKLKDNADYQALVKEGAGPQVRSFREQLKQDAQNLRKSHAC